MKKLMLVLGLVVLSLCATTAQASFVINDLFDNFNTDLWTDFSHDGGWATAQDGYLDLGTTAGVHYGRGRANSNFSLSGNFLTQVDFSLPTFNDFYSSACLYAWATDGSFGMRIARTVQYDGSQNIESSFQINGNWQGDWSASNDDMRGGFRFDRSGNSLSAFYLSGDTWELAGNTLLPTNSDVMMILEIGNNGQAGNAPHVEAQYDNFMADADNINNIDPKYISENPEPGTLILLGTGLLGLGTFTRMRRRK